MLQDSENHLLRKIYGEIIRGYSCVHLNKKLIYIKHFSSLDHVEIDHLYSEFYENALKRGYYSEKSQLEQLEKDTLWFPKDEKKINDLRESIRFLFSSKKNAFLRRDIDSINSQIKEAEDKLGELHNRREYLIGQTAEKFTKKKVDAEFIFTSLFLDPKLKNYLYSKEEFDELDKNDVSALFGLYNTFANDFSDINLKKIVLQDFFQSAYYLSNNLFEFFGKPICTLTNYQLSLSAYGNYYKTILSSENRPPEEFLADPIKLEEWYNGRNSAEKVLEKTNKIEGGNVSLVGATEEDLKFLGYEQTGAVSLMKATEDAGGMMDMEALMKLHGIN